MNIIFVFDFGIIQNVHHSCMPVVITCVTEENLPLIMRHTAWNQSTKHCQVVIASTESLISYTHASVVVCTLACGLGSVHTTRVQGLPTRPVNTGVQHGRHFRHLCSQPVFTGSADIRPVLKGRVSKKHSHAMLFTSRPFDKGSVCGGVWGP